MCVSSKKLSRISNFLTLLTSLIFIFLTSACSYWGKAEILDKIVPEPIPPKIPHKLKNFNKTSENINSMSIGSGKILFNNFDFEHNKELWISDGTEPGTHFLKEIYPGIADSTSLFTIAGSNISFFNYNPASGITYFFANDSIHGLEMWRSDGTEAGTYFLYDFYPGAGNVSNYTSNFKNVVNQNNLMFFTYQNKPWITDGTPAGTVPLAASNNWSYVSPSGGVTSWNGLIYFAAVTATVPSAIWKTDGTDAGTQMVVQLTMSSSPPYYLLPYSGKLYFNLTDNLSGNHGSELWVTDETVPGTVMVKDIVAGATGSGAQAIGIYNSKILLNTSSGYYVSNGTAAGTTSLFGITAHLGILGNKLLFIGNGGAGTNYELWVTDGTAPGTVLLKEIYPGATASNISNQIILGIKMIFTATDDIHGNELWVTDGTSGGTQLLADINPGPNSSGVEFMTTVGSSIVFSALSNNGRELWITDGTQVGTHIFADLNPGSAGSAPKNLIALDSNRFFFTAFNPQNESAVAYVGDVSNNNLAMTTSAQIETMGVTGSSNFLFHTVNSKLIFPAMDDIKGNPIWTSDGTEAGTTKMIDLSPNTSCVNARVFNFDSNTNASSIFFTGSNDNNTYDLWKSDGSLSGSQLITNAFNGGYNLFGTLNNGLTVGTADSTSDGEVFFYTNSTPNNYSTYDTDLTANSSEYLLDGFINSNKSLVYYLMYNFGATLWVSDGTVAGTTQITNLGLDGAGNTITFWSGGGVLFQLANSAIICSDYMYEYANHTIGFPHGCWSTQGTNATTVQFAPSVYENFSGPSEFVFNDRFYFFKSDATYGVELWSTDGTIGGTQLLKDITPGTGNTSFSSNLIEAENYFIFVANAQFWVSDGTTAGTQLLNSNASSIGTYFLSNNNSPSINGKIYFVGTDATNGSELWVTDGTISGTKLIKDINPGTPNSAVQPIYVFENSGSNQLLFIANDGVNGNQIWASDGTAAGTRAITNTTGGLSVGYEKVQYNGKLYFAGTTTDYGAELWVTDGTEAGTKQVYDLNPGKFSSSPTNLYLYNNKLFFTAKYGSSDEEIYYLELD